jgi:hypothetical protein
MLGIKPVDPQGTFFGGDVFGCTSLYWSMGRSKATTCGVINIVSVCYYINLVYTSMLHKGFGGYKYNNIEVGTYTYIYIYIYILILSNHT